jgi:hypothetical protein
MLHLLVDRIPHSAAYLDAHNPEAARHGTFTGAFKPGNRSRQVKGLYLCGGAAHPGPGMPMVMMSGWIAADAMDTDMGGRGMNEAARVAGSREIPVLAAE